MADITISGTLQVHDNNGQPHTIDASDFIPDEHLDGPSVTFGYDNGDFSASIIAENKNGAISKGDWDTENCTVVNDNIVFS